MYGGDTSCPASQLQGWKSGMVEWWNGMATHSHRIKQCFKHTATLYLCSCWIFCLHFSLLVFKLQFKGKRKPLSGFIFKDQKIDLILWTAMRRTQHNATQHSAHHSTVRKDINLRPLCSSNPSDLLSALTLWLKQQNKIQWNSKPK